jgi:hypothetical protein
MHSSLERKTNHQKGKVTSNNGSSKEKETKQPNRNFNY